MSKFLDVEEMVLIINKFHENTSDTKISNYFKNYIKEMKNPSDYYEKIKNYADNTLSPFKEMNQLWLKHLSDINNFYKKNKDSYENLTKDDTLMLINKFNEINSQVSKLIPK